MPAAQFGRVGKSPSEGSDPRPDQIRPLRDAEQEADPRGVGVIQRILSDARRLDGGGLSVQKRMARRIAGRGILRRKVEQGPRVRFHREFGRPHRLRERDPARLHRLLREKELSPRGGDLRVRTRGVGSGTECPVGERVHRLREHLPAFEVRAAEGK
jgi:hypothetical protein